MTLALGALLAASVASSAEPPASLTLRQALVLAEDYSPELKAAQARVLQAESEVEISKSDLYPSLNGQAGFGYGFLGGDNSLIGVEQLVIQQEKGIGPIGGLISDVNLYNASAFSTIALAKKNLDYFAAVVALIRYQVDLTAARAYLEAARDLGGSSAWEEAGTEMEALLAEVESFTKSGIQSPVDVLLVKDQVSQARIEKKAFDARYAAALKALGALVGRPGSSLACPPALGLSEGEADVFLPGTSPYLRIGQSQVKVAEATVDQKKAANYPVIKAMGGVDTGEYGSSYLNPGHDYALGIGIKLPLFEGYRIVEQTKQARNLVAQRGFDLDSAQVQVDAQSAAFDESIESSRAEVEGLAPEYAELQRALVLARRRYRDFQGPLVDVREALRDMARVRLTQSDAMAELLFSLAGKSLLNGGTVRR